MLVKTNAVSQQQVDDDTAKMQGARAELEAAKAQVAGWVTAIDSAKTGIVQAKTRVDAATTTERRITADLDDSVLKASREVLGAGGCFEYGRP